MDVYRIAVEIQLAGNIAQALTGIAGQMTGLHGQIGRINTAFGSWTATLGVVAGAAGIGLVVAGLERVFETTRKVSDALTAVKELGAGTTELARLQTSAVSIAEAVPGATIAGIYGTYGQVRNIFARNPEEAFRALPDIVTLDQALKNDALLHGRSVEGADNDMMKLLRSADLMGQMTDKEGNLDLEKLNRFFEVSFKAYVGTHGAIGPSEWINIAKQGGIALNKADETGLLGAAVVAQAMGGNRFGTAEMSLFQQFAGGTMSPAKAQALQDLGILHAGKWHSSRGGGVVIDEDEKKRLSEFLASGDPLAMGAKLKEALVQAGYTDPQDQIRMLFSVLARATTQREMGDIIRNQPQMMAEVEALKNAQTPEEAILTQNATSISVALNNISSALENLYTAIGESHGSQIVAGLNHITEWINGLAGMVHALDKGEFREKYFPSIHDPYANGREVPFGHADDGTSSPSLNVAPETPKSAIDSWGNAKKMNFVAPPRTDKPTVLKAALNIDSRQLAEAVSYALADMFENSPNAASANGASILTYNGHNPVV